MASLTIPPNEIQFEAHSFIDPNGRVFEWKGEIYRAISNGYAPFCRNLFEKGIVENLAKDGLLVESEIVDRSLSAGDLILRHRRIPVVSYCFEWPAVMLKRAALLTIELCIRLAEHDLTLQDAHPWNILFEGTKPVFIDLSSIVPASDDILWAPYQQFCNFFLFPLYLYSAKQERMARWFLHDVQEGVTDGDVARAMPITSKLRHPLRSLRISIPRILGKAAEKLPMEIQDQLWNLSKRVNNKLMNKKTRIRFFESVGRGLESVKLPVTSSHWTKYYKTADQSRFKTGLSPGDWVAKEQSFLKIIRDLHPKTVLDLGCNTGHYARLAAENGASVIASDTDSASINVCYQQAAKNNLDILPLVVNAFNPSLAIGRGGMQCPPTTERFRSELVVGLALMHHLVSQQRIDLNRMLEFFRAYSRRWVLIEFIPALPRRVGTTFLAELDDYTMETLKNTIMPQFKQVSIFDSFPNDRKLFLCEK